MSTTTPDTVTALDSFFHPTGIALIGASRDPAKLSYGVLTNLLYGASSFPGPVYPVNPHADTILGRRCYPDIASVPDPVDLAILVIPADMVEGAIEACGRRGIRAAIVISGGFREVGAEGAAREQRMVATARNYGMRIMGPNGIGVIDTHTPLNTTFVVGTPTQGEIAFLSQSGALCGGIIDWVVGRGIGFSRMLSVGNEADIHEADLLPYLAEDAQTKVIAMYLEEVKDGPGFLDAIRSIAPLKPLLAIKAGRTASGQAATASHTGALASPHAAFRAACRQHGVIEFESIEAMFNGGLALAYQPLPQGSRIAIVTNAGGPAALAADTLGALGLTLARTHPAIQAELRKTLHADAQVAGPIDLLGGATEHEYAAACATLLQDPELDAILAIIVPQALVNTVAVVEQLAATLATAANPKPMILCLMGEASLSAAFAAAHRHRLPAYVFPEAAVGALATLVQRFQWLVQEHSAPSPPRDFDAAYVRALCTMLSHDNRTNLSMVQSADLLTAAGIRVPQARVAHSEEEAVQMAEAIGYPLVLKLISGAISHKTEVGGVILNLTDVATIRLAFQALRDRAAKANIPFAGVYVQRMVTGGHEIILGIKRDPTFGPLVLFGLGGIYAEALASVSFRLAPLTSLDAAEMIAEVPAAKILAGWRGQPVADMAALIDTIVRLGWLAWTCPEILEGDINPLLVLPAGQPGVSAPGALAADARFVIG